MNKSKPNAGEKSEGGKSVSKAASRTNGKSASKSKSSPLTQSKSSALKKASTRRSTIDRALAKLDMDQLGTLPHGYGTNSIFLVAQDPHWLFTYWDIDISRHPGGPCHLRVEDENGVVEQEIAVPFETRNWYVQVGEAGKNHTVEIGFYRGKSWKPLARSATVATPRDRFSESDAFNFATIPLHIGFQRLVDTISSSMTRAEEEKLVPALAELQRSAAQGGSSEVLLHANERAILVTLLGSEFLAELSSAQWGSEELHSAIHRRLQERLASGELGELMARIQLGHAESSLSSMFARFAAESTSASGNLASAGLTERIAAGLSSWLTSWSVGVPGGLAAISSGELSSGALQAGAVTSGGLSSGALSVSALSSGGLSSGAVSSAGFPGAGFSIGGLSSVGLSSGALSSGGLSSGVFSAGAFAGAGITSWAGGGSEIFPFNLSSWAGLETSSAENLASWGQLSSWLAAIGSSWSGINLSSFEQAALSSWASSAMSSWAEGASSSWGSSEMSSGPSPAESRLDFNAEITLRGQARPGARVFVGGQSVDVRVDGSFEHRVVVSGGHGSVPVEAIGPDGRHTHRSAILLQPASV